eukprot:351220-Rhodomonas_salina.1
MTTPRKRGGNWHEKGYAHRIAALGTELARQLVREDGLAGAPDREPLELGREMRPDLLGEIESVGVEEAAAVEPAVEAQDLAAVLLLVELEEHVQALQKALQH